MSALPVQQHGTGSPAMVLPPPSRLLCVIKCKGKEEGQRASPVVHPCGVQDSESTASLHQVCEWVWGLPSLKPDDRGFKTNIFEIVHAGQTERCPQTADMGLRPHAFSASRELEKGRHGGEQPSFPPGGPRGGRCARVTPRWPS